MDELPDISKEFLESILHRTVDSFTIKSGTNVGDNYMSVLYSIHVKLQPSSKKGEEETEVHLLSKCVPSHPTRQGFLMMSNIFWNEMSVYTKFIPALANMAKESGLVIKLPFAPYISGESPDFAAAKKAGDNQYAGRVFGPFEIYIMMTDLRKSGFRMANRLLGLDYDHVVLVMEAHSKLHALSWAYKQKKGIKALGTEFPFMDFQMTEEDYAMFGGAMKAAVTTTITTLEEEEGKDSPLTTGTVAFGEKIDDIMHVSFGSDRRDTEFTDLHRVPRDKAGNDEEDWRVALHGDCWINNLLFRYDEKTKKPLEITLVDLQMVRERCPTLDMVYLLYTSTDVDFRKKHLKEMLQVYHDSFVKYCNIMDVEPLPNFNIQELERRFHRSKVLGYFMAMMVLPIILKDAADIRDLEKMESNANMDDMFATLGQNVGDNSAYRKKIVRLARELYEEGVI